MRGYRIPLWGILRNQYRRGCDLCRLCISVEEGIGEICREIIKDKENSAENSCCCHQKATPRDEKELRQLKNRLSRMMGQLNGIGKMLDENRYCGDILTQIAAVESALQAFGYLILQEHMETCVVGEIQKGNTAVVDEAVEPVKKLK